MSTERRLVMLDFDGTLVPIAPRPGAIRVPDEVPPTLACLREAGHVVWIVSGRRVNDVRRYLADPCVVGLHGAEWPDRPPPPRHPALSAAAARVAPLADRFPGLFAEDKGATVAFHARGAEDPEAALAAVRDAIGELPPGLSVLRGHAVLELRPDSATKAHAVRRLCVENPGLSPVYVGDDATDEEAFAALPPGGLSVRVAAPGTPTVATLRVDDVPAVLRLLGELCGQRVAK